MTAFLGTDPKNGGTWATEEQVTNTQANQILDWIEAIDRAKEIRAFTSVGGWAQIGGGDTAICAAYDPTIGFWVVGGKDNADGSSAIVRTTDAITLDQDATITDVGELVGIASNGAGMFVACGDDAGDSADKLLSSPDAITWTMRSLSAAHAFGCTGAIWDPANAKFVVSVQSYLEYSSDGITWTQATFPTALGSMDLLATNGSGITVAADTTADRRIIFTEDCETWYARRLDQGSCTALTWSQSDLCFFVTTNSTIDKSEAGEKWYTGSATLPDDVSTVQHLASTENHVLISYYDGNMYWLAASDDACRTWRKTCMLGSASNFLEYSNGQVLLGTGTGIIAASTKAATSL